MPGTSTLLLKRRALQAVCIFVGRQLAKGTLHSGHSNRPADSVARVHRYAGAAIALAGVAISHVADMQKYRFNAKVPSGGQRKWIATGLWKYSRHPNYFGENVAWLGMFVLSSGGLASWSTVGLAAVSPSWSAFFLVFTSLMLLEKRLDQRFGGNAEYERYKRQTSVLLLWPPRGD